jgi:hypothetical protein
MCEKPTPNGLGLTYALKQDDYLKQISEQDRVDDKTAFVIKRG